MPLPHIFGTVPAGAEVPGSWLDDDFNAVGILGVIPCTVTGSNTLIATPGAITPPITSLTPQLTIQFIVVSNNTGPVTINLNGLGAKALTKVGSTPLSSGDLQAGAAVICSYDGTEWQLMVSTSVSTITTSAIWAATL